VASVPFSTGTFFLDKAIALVEDPSNMFLNAPITSFASATLYRDSPLISFKILIASIYEFPSPYIELSSKSVVKT